MKSNLVLAIFKTESEACEAFTELRANPAGAGYTAPEAALIKKNQEGALDTLEAFGSAPANNTAAGAVIGGIIGLLGGPLGVLLGAAVGGFAGQIADAENVIDEMSLIAVVTSKIYEGEVAIAALVEEEEPAFDAAFEKYETTIIRYDAADIAAEVAQLEELEAVVVEQAIEEARTAAERKETAEVPPAKTEKLTGWRSATNRALEC